MWEHTQFSPFWHSSIISFGCVGICSFHFGSCQFYWNHLRELCPAIIAPSSLSSSYMPSNSAASSVARSVDNTVVARFVGVQFGGIDGICCGWIGCVGVQFNRRNFVSSFSFSSSFAAMQERRTTFSHSDQYSTDTPSLVTPLPPLLDTKFFHFLQILQRMLSLSHPVS